MMPKRKTTHVKYFSDSDSSSDDDDGGSLMSFDSFNTTDSEDSDEFEEFEESEESESDVDFDFNFDFEISDSDFEQEEESEVEDEYLFTESDEDSSDYESEDMNEFALEDEGLFDSIPSSSSSSSSNPSQPVASGGQTQGQRPNASGDQAQRSRRNGIFFPPNTSQTQGQRPNASGDQAQRSRRNAIYFPNNKSQSVPTSPIKIDKFRRNTTSAKSAPIVVPPSSAGSYETPEMGSEDNDSDSDSYPWVTHPPVPPYRQRVVNNIRNLRLVFDDEETKEDPENLPAAERQEKVNSPPERLRDTDLQFIRDKQTEWKDKPPSPPPLADEGIRLSNYVAIGLYDTEKPDNFSSKVFPGDIDYIDILDENFQKVNKSTKLIVTSYGDDPKTETGSRGRFYPPVYGHLKFVGRLVLTLGKDIDMFVIDPRTDYIWRIYAKYEPIRKISINGYEKEASQIHTSGQHLEGNVRKPIRATIGEYYNDTKGYLKDVNSFGAFHIQLCTA